MRSAPATLLDYMPYPAALMAFALFLTACSDQPWNRPYPAENAGRNILYTSFNERPNHLDPAQSYSSNEVTFTGQIYEPPLQYHYLKRPYQLIPLTATRLPVAHYLDADGNRLPDEAAGDVVAYSYYDVNIRPGIHYQPHPAFARNAEGELLYHALTADDLADVYTLGDFAATGSRELTAADYVYQIKRLAHPGLHSPILGLMSDYIVGLGDYSKTLEAAWQQAGGGEAAQYLDLDKYPLSGAEVIDRYTYRITLHGKYPQLLYWLAMPFFGPVPAEADAFYSQPGMKERNITLDWYPVGTGPYLSLIHISEPTRRRLESRFPA